VGGRERPAVGRWGNVVGRHGDGSRRGSGRGGGEPGRSSQKLRGPG
jgi:hypothetical protein